MIMKFDGVTVRQLAELVAFSQSPEGCFLFGNEANENWRTRLHEGVDWTQPAISFREAKLSGQSGFEPLFSITLVIAEKHWVDSGNSSEGVRNHYGFEQRDVPRAVIDRIYAILGRYPQA